MTLKLFFNYFFKKQHKTSKPLFSKTYRQDLQKSYKIAYEILDILKQRTENPNGYPEDYFN